ncbi:hypothetical protein EMPS_03428 [Entomortierella parvispora]|uniref:Uncharacterized protein n=1 Tax=Entomortierella parvispora TaxID=205924 RepID=A0A9P3LUI5_9FUNG|nr:hypothetical protein EMPS_03428 [Entomortierella parvispora]
MSFITIGSYSGPSAEDPDAAMRELFTVPGNQQDGLSSILRYVQTKAGFTVGSTDTSLFHKILQDEFSDIVIYYPDRSTKNETRFSKVEPNEMIKNNAPPQKGLDVLPANQALQTKPLADGRGTLTKSTIQFLNRMDGNDITLDVVEEYRVSTGFAEAVVKNHCTYIVNRSRMAERADWLVDTVIRDSLEEWCRRITSQGH